MRRNSHRKRLLGGRAPGFAASATLSSIRAVLRRARPGKPPLAAAQRLACGNLVLDRQSRRAYVGSREANLTPKALALLEYMMTHPDELLTRDRLLDAVPAPKSGM